ncbi:Fe-Mn family superoxide dismutase, partial [Staphylococcus sp. SIMBA_130]
VWEHAYYLQYENKRKRYIDNWWSIVNWNEVNKRFAKARQLTWKPFYYDYDRYGPYP